MCLLVLLLIGSAPRIAADDHAAIIVAADAGSAAAAACGAATLNAAGAVNAVAACVVATDVAPEFKGCSIISPFELTAAAIAVHTDAQQRAGTYSTALSTP